MGSKGEGTDYRYSNEAFQEIGKAVAQLGRALEGARQLQVDVVGINIKRPKVSGGEYLLIVKGLDAEGTPCVAFHGAFDLGEALRGLDSRLRNGSLKWKIDQFMA